MFSPLGCFLLFFSFSSTFLLTDVAKITQLWVCAVGLFQASTAGRAIFLCERFTFVNLPGPATQHEAATTIHHSGVGSRIVVKTVQSGLIKQKKTLFSYESGISNFFRWTFLSLCPGWVTKVACSQSSHNCLGGIFHLTRTKIVYNFIFFLLFVVDGSYTHCL